MLVFATLGAPERRLLDRRRSRDAEPRPAPQPVTTSRATIIEVSEPLEESAAGAWLEQAGEEHLATSIAVLNRALHAFRLATADALLFPVSRERALVARLGYGRGEEVADGRWQEARELLLTRRREKRSAVLAPQARVAALLTGQEQPLACEELALRARLDLDHGRSREAALGLLVTLDAAIAELSADPAANALRDRIAELRQRRDPIADAAQAALAGPVQDAHREAVESALGRIEAALRARAYERS